MDEIKNCPICGKIMIKGYIPNYRDNVAWYPFNHKWIFKLPFRRAKNSLNLQNDINNKYYCISYLCTDCKKIIIEVPDTPNNDINKFIELNSQENNQK